MQATSRWKQIGYVARSWLVVLVLALPFPAQAQYRYETNNGTITITRYTGPGGAVTIPSRIDGRRVTRIGIRAFEARFDLTRVTIPNTVTRIDSNAFMSCFNLTRATIPDSVTRMEGFAFFACMNLARVRLGAGITDIPVGLFGNCRSLAEVTLPAGVTNIDATAFTRCESLTRLVIPGKVRSIGPRAFWNCVNLRSVLVGRAVNEIWADAFKDCIRLSAVNFQGDRPRLILAGIFDGASLAKAYYLPWKTNWGAAYSGRPAKAGDAYEPDNTKATAKAIANGKPQFHCVHAAGDTDWAKFTVRSGGARKVRLETAGAGIDTEMWLYRSNGRMVKYDNNSGPGSCSRIAVAALDPGTYYLKVRKFGNTETTPFFTLSASWTVP